MVKKKQRHSIPPPWVVRSVAVVLLLIDIVIMAVLAISYQSLDWTGYVLFIAAATSTYFPIMALKTGDPEWVLLDLIIPG